MVLTIIKSGLVLLLAQSIIMTGVFFMSGHILPNTLQNVYEHTNGLTRMVIALLVCFTTGNYLISQSYVWFNPAIVTPVNIAAVVVVLITFTVLILKARFSLMLIPATAMVLLGCVWVSYLLSQKSL